MALEKELETYQKELPHLLERAGKFVVIKNDSVVGVYDTYEDALTAGYERAKLEPFLVKEIGELDETQIFVNNTVGPCPI